MVSVAEDRTAGKDPALVAFGLGWDPVKRKLFGDKRDIDLNAAALLFDRTALVDVVFHEQLLSKDGSVRLLGDNLTGEGDGDDEIISVDLTRVAPGVTTILFLVTSYSGQSFDRIGNAFCRVVDSTTGSELSRKTLAHDGSTGFIAGKLTRAQQNWAYEVIGTPIEAQHPVEAIGALAPYL
ncbi:tellurium resistance TerZ family protein [Nocardia sp. NEAU-351]|uniref:Tellurium resistance TerZ family protein n=2 Tax=Nocardia bovistercoris TaxID=2785916 RepID=A0A931N1D0_9NOCA|nr:TerD family protein [Nocardia bovistercoris]MBH0775849.1 tellurium resistance TerZ family protein [Nocardia bovistercoris]